MANPVWTRLRALRPGAALLVCALAWLPARGAAADEALARQRYADGEAAFGSGRYLDAATAFEAAYAESHRPRLLWNVAQSYRRQFEVDHDLAHLRRALTVYRNFIGLAPSDEDRAEADQALRELGEQIAHAEAEAARVERAAAEKVANEKLAAERARLLKVNPVDDEARISRLAEEMAAADRRIKATEEEARRRRVTEAATVGKGLRIAGAVAIAAGIALTLSSVIFFFEGKAQSDQARDALSQAGAVYSPAVQGNIARSVSDQYGAVTMPIVGAVVTIAGSVLHHIGVNRRKHAEEEAQRVALTVEPRWSPSAASLGLRVRF